ncbi:DUF4179 domain-containing protein, partial [Clostridium perfringens]|uniref:DUF4179 domain-containing protein n=1 Tax=Clostridium perfringens TaxID=1502 RepID=UPI002ACC1845
INKDLEDYKTVVNSSVSKNGITIQLNEVILDKDEIIISTTVKSDTSLGAVGEISPFGSVYINNEKISSASGGGSKQIDEYTTEAVLSYQLDKNLPNGDLNIEIKYTDALIIGAGKEIEGPWTFKFKANGDTLAI